MVDDLAANLVCQAAFETELWECPNLKINQMKFMVIDEKKVTYSYNRPLMYQKMEWCLKYRAQFLS